VLCFGSVNFCDGLNQIFYRGTVKRAYIILVPFKVPRCSNRQTKESARAHSRVFAHTPEEKGGKLGVGRGEMAEALTIVRAKEMSFLKDSKSCMYHDQPL
jgi:hypothetical protein